MLVLSRKQKQQIKIGDDVVITVLQIKGGSVRIGIEAPREVHVMRSELEELRDPEPKPSLPKILVMTKQSQSSDEASAEPGSDKESNSGSERKILNLGIQDEGADVISPTRLSEIASSIPSLNLPR